MKPRNAGEVIEDVIRSVPVNKAAARVTAKGVGYECPKKIMLAHSATPIKTRPVAKGQPDLTGSRCGRFVVKGLAADSEQRADGSLWVVRCDCGNYATRRTRAIKNENNKADCCEECRHLEYLKRKAEFRAYGKNSA